MLGCLASVTLLGAGGGPAQGGAGSPNKRRAPWPLKLEADWVLRDVDVCGGGDRMLKSSTPEGLGMEREAVS